MKGPRGIQRDKEVKTSKHPKAFCLQKSSWESPPQIKQPTIDHPSRQHDQCNKDRAIVYQLTHYTFCQGNMTSARNKDRAIMYQSTHYTFCQGNMTSTRNCDSHHGLLKIHYIHHYMSWQYDYQDQLHLKKCKLRVRQPMTIDHFGVI